MSIKALRTGSKAKQWSDFPSLDFAHIYRGCLLCEIGHHFSMQWRLVGSLLCIRSDLRLLDPSAGPGWLRIDLA
jgi:hypothetical protein